MTKPFLRILPLLIFLNAIAVGAQSLTIKKDLRSEWLAYYEDKFIPFADAEGASSVVYLKLKNPQPDGEYLKIVAPRPLVIFVNNRVVGQFDSHVFNIDSLSGNTAGEFVLSIYLKDVKPRELTTALMTRGSVTPKDDMMEARPASYFHDFVVIGALILMVIVVFMVRLNPKLASDYFSLPRIFSFREMDDSQVYTRIASSANILFYVYCSLLLGFYLIVVFHFVSSLYPLGYSFESDSFGGVFLQWLKLSSILLGLLLLKIIIVVSFSSLFGIAEVAGIHFFNWVRIVVVFLGMLTLFLIIYFLRYGQDFTLLSVMLKLLGWLFAGWIVLIFLKLTGKSRTSMFHLFSYICATELIPFLFIIRVLYK